MSEITTCKTCPLYAKTAEVKDATGLPYFAMCKGSGRLINEAAAKTLPGSDLCPAKSPLLAVTTASTVHRLAESWDAGDHMPSVTAQTREIAEPLNDLASPPALRPDACHRCVFFVPKVQGAETYPGTPVARYDTCAKKGMLVMPGTRKTTAEDCSEGLRLSPGGIQARPIDIKIHSQYLSPDAPAATFDPVTPLADLPDDTVLVAAETTASAFARAKAHLIEAEGEAARARLIEAEVASSTVESMLDASKIGHCGNCFCDLYANPHDGAASLDIHGRAHCHASGATHWLIPTKVSPTSTATPEPKETTPVSTAGKTADIAASTTEDALAKLLSGLAGVGAVLDAPDPTTIDSPEVISASPDDTVESDEVTADGRKALPKRPKTGMIFKASAYDLSAFEPLPEGALGVVAVRSTSKASDVVFLPRYDETLWPDAVRAEVPVESDTQYLDHNDVLFRCAVSYAADHVAALWGDAGVGKTEGVEHMARLTRQPFMRISIKWATQVDDLMGRWSLTDGSMVWLEGRFVKGWRAPYVMCVDEPNCGKDEVWQALRAPFDGAQTLVLDEKDGERIPRHPSARIYTAMNPSWDPRFTGTQPLNDADLDRMDHITVPYPTEDVERAILAAKAPWLNEEQVTMMLHSARDIRAAVQANTIRISFGIRKMLRWADAMQYMHPLAAFKQSVTNWMEPSSARLLADIVDAYAR